MLERGTTDMADLVIYGATPAGARLLADRRASERVLCFVDHDRQKAGTIFEGLNVVAPAALLDLTFDRLLVATTDVAGTLTFLIRLGIPIDKVEAADVRQGPVDARPTAVIYGSRLEALRTFQHIANSYNVLCFCDPDPARLGKRMADRFVVAPADLCALSFDRVFLGVKETHDALHNLLWHWSVPLDRMDVVPESVLTPPERPSTSDRQRYVIFGAGSSGEAQYRRLSPIGEVIAFVDNSTAKHGTEFCGRPVVAPLALATLEYDQVVIGSMFAAEILNQLVALGVDTRRIVIPDAAVPGGGIPADTAASPPVALLRRLIRRAAMF